MPERKILASITAITDHDTEMYRMGEIGGAFRPEELKDHIRSYGPDELLFQLAYMNHQIVTAIQEINIERDSNEFSSRGPM